MKGICFFKQEEARGGASGGNRERPFPVPAFSPPLSGKVILRTDQEIGPELRQARSDALL
jgi:hypothetical protein